MKICFLASSNGGNFKFFYLSKKLGFVKNIELYLIADRDCKALEFARDNNIYHKKILYRKIYNNQLLEELENIDPDIIVTSWYKIIDGETVKKYYGKMINLHYSLLPAFSGFLPGAEAIKLAYQRNCSYIGVTCHYVDEGVDSGKIIAQAIIRRDVPFEDAVQKLFEKGCLILLNSILLITNNKDIIKIEKNSKFDFSPDLLFDDNQFDNNFWKELSHL